MVDTRSTIDLQKEASTIIQEANKSGAMDITRIQAVPPKVWGQVCTALDIERLINYNQLLMQPKYMKELQEVLAARIEAEKPAFTHRKIQEAGGQNPAGNRPPTLDLSSVGQQVPMLEEVYYSDHSSTPRLHKKRHTLTTDGWANIDYLMGDPAHMLRQLRGVRMSPEKAFETRNKILRKALVDAEIDNTDKLIIRVNQLIDQGLITHDLSVNILLSCAVYGKEGTMRRIESGAILKPINIYNLSSRKRPDERKPRTQNQSPNTYNNSNNKKKNTNSYNNQNRFFTTACGARTRDCKTKSLALYRLS
ncbi:hypothetical protein GNI_228840 [Gregarina niphandrodes]|uniref:Uncharacterized protein n=1 Tax=Gregarina niphandrodes TaxID=110365 RepID=A0A023AVJ3_GRENI|nr:hypothetical protein GNI_228840 [Gregarina niphandrodes]EZG42766.1 hypothetical protein GNI_228840 [Gregarina niphandrodes]|eukprot:XP_011133956.1 hypothetical protein GNI_228840 [Gregarina niphandrodes]